ncbi:TMEM175 family protein [Synechococcus sp. BMK-MC-1]|uniref:TMEM175 family protein n=1 Tax=Synechococcus sp. BMK-MC-1 TaxID=1442551 RepID=UPI0016477D5F
MLNSEAINRYLREQPPSLGIYFTSFVLVGCYWQSRLSMASRFSRSDTTHRWLQLGGSDGCGLAALRE